MTKGLPHEDYVVTDRGGIIENKYVVHAAVVDSRGRTLYAVGDPNRLTLARSAAKPAQALAILETGGPDHFGFNDADVALMCASHSSEDRHITRARKMLEKVGEDEGALKCGGHPAINEKVNRSWIRQDFVPGAVCNNCSGKHAGMIAGTKKLGADVNEYHLPGHPMQARVKSVVEELSGLVSRPDEVRWGIDGCNLPAPAMRLNALALTYAGFAGAVDAVELNKGMEQLPRRISQMSRVFYAMTQYPDMVGGEERFCTQLMQAFKGLLIGKIGADGCYGIGIRMSDQTRRLGADGAIGIAVKIEDGNINILYSAVTEILEQLEIGTPEMRQQLSGFHCQQILNTVGVVTGHVSHRFKIRPVAELLCN